MTEEVRSKLQSVYNAALGRIPEIYEVFVDYFGEQYVDLSCATFEEFLNWLGDQTLGGLGIKQWDTEQYHIDKEDYELNGRGKKFLDYIPDLGIIDYLSPVLQRWVRGTLPSSGSPYLYVYFPQVRITNEFDRYIDITKLFVRIPVTLEGKTPQRFQMVRTEYSFIQWYEGYSHSHLPSINKEHPERWDTPCTGSGPINDTINTLYHRCDLDIWGLYALELAKYVTVESIAGTPYFRMETVGKGLIYPIGELEKPVYNIGSFTRYSNGGIRRIEEAHILPFVNYFLNQKSMKFSYKEGCYLLGEPLIDFWVRVSNSFIDWYNSSRLGYSLQTLKETNLLMEAIIADGRAYKANAPQSEIPSNIEGRTVLSFKGELQRIHIESNPSAGVGENKTLLVSPIICSFILTKALSILNYHYGKEQKQRPEAAASEQNASSGAGQAVFGQGSLIF